MNYDKFQFAELLKRFKETARFSYARLAERSGIPEQTLKRWILDLPPQKPPPRERLLCLAAALDLSRAQTLALLDLTDYPYPATDDLARLIDQVPNSHARGVLQQWVAKTGLDQRAALGAGGDDLSTESGNDEADAPAASLPFPLEPPEGAMGPASPFYVERPEDHLLQQELRRPGMTITIKGPGQVGKSSLLNRLLAGTLDGGKKGVILNFQLFDQPTLANADIFFRQFCAWLTAELGLENQVEPYWRSLNNIQRCTRYLSRYVLKAVDQPLSLMMDRVETIFETDFSTDFFGMLRSWHDSRGILTQPVWKQLDLVLVTSTEPFQFVKNLNQSPFNVGVIVDLIDFTLAQVADLNRRHGSPLTETQVRQLMRLVAGHPYLVRQALYLVASQRLSPPDLFDRATADDGPFGLHLQRHLRRLHHQPEQQAALKQVIEQRALTDEPLFFRLQGAGLVRRDKRNILPRCQLYADYFKERLYD